jgi:hypothetical protein
MLSEALQRNSKHEARLSNISDCHFGSGEGIVPEIESLASPRKSSGLRCSFALLRMTMILARLIDLPLQPFNASTL